MVAEAFAFGGAFDEAGDVDKFDGGGDDFFGADDLGELVEAGVWNSDCGFVWFDGAEGEVLGVGLFLAGEQVEEGGFSDIWEADDGDLEHFRRWKIKRQNVKVGSFCQIWRKRSPGFAFGVFAEDEGEVGLGG